MGEPARAVCRLPKAAPAGPRSAQSAVHAQDLSRYALKYAAIGSAVIALLPLATIAGSLYQLAFGKNTGDLRATFIHCGAERIDLAIANLGSAPVVINSANFSSSDSSVDNLAIRRISGASQLPDDDKQPILVEPNAAGSIISYAAFIGRNPTRFPVHSPGVGTCKYRVSLSSVDLDGISRRDEPECKCAQL